MGSSLCPLCSYLWLSVAVLFVFLLIPIGFSNPDLYTACSTKFVCGNLSVGYPFWGDRRPDTCGVPDMELKCENGNSIIEIEGVVYRVLEINENDKILKIARQDYMDGICQPLFMNTTLDSEYFEYASGYRNVTILYGCPPTIFGVNEPSLFDCDIRGSAFKSGYALWDFKGPGLCYRSVAVPVSEVSLTTDVFNLSFLQVSLKQGFEVKRKVDHTACNNCISSEGACGYDLSTNQSTCYCRGQLKGSKSCLSSQEIVPAPSGGKSNRVSLVIGLSIAAAVIVGICLVCFYCFTRRRRLRSGNLVKPKKGNKAENRKIEAFITDYQSHMPKQYSYSEIKKMTASFSHKLGQGGFGGVYKGKLPDGRAVAVKVLSMSKGDGEDFTNEVASISRTSHVNIVSLLGFCYERTKRALIYEYMPSGSLDKFINGEGSQHNKQHLEWKTLYDIAVGIARGIEYLHRGCSTRIVHFDIKPHNILLDEDFCPKVSDFGLAKLCKGKESIVSMFGARGTIGYIAPEIFIRNFGGVSYKSDVYSYGMVILEMFAGRNIDVGASRSSETYFSDWIYTYLESEKISTLHEKITDEEKETVRRMIIVGLWCIQANPSDRPSMTKVVEMLGSSLESLAIPPKPVLFSTTAPPDFSSTLSSTPCVWCEEGA